MFYTPPGQSPASSLESVTPSAAKKAAGINIELKSKNFNYQIANFNDADPSVAKHTNEWGISNFGGLARLLPDVGRGLQQHGLLQLWRLQQPDRGQAHQAVRARNGPQCGDRRGLVPDQGRPDPVHAQLRLRLRGQQARRRLGRLVPR